MLDPKIRSFLAIELDPLLIHELNDFVLAIQPQYSQFKFVSSECWHLTLHFFGSLSHQSMDHLIGMLPGAVSKIQPFSVSLKGLGGFPSQEKSRILWIGVDVGRKYLVDLKETLDEMLLKLNFSVETRTYDPHLTIARSRNLAAFHMPDAQRNVVFERRSKVDHLTLFRSDLLPQGAKYTPLQHFYFTASD